MIYAVDRADHAGHIGIEPHIPDIDKESGGQRKDRKDDEHDDAIEQRMLFCRLSGLFGHKDSPLNVIVSIITYKNGICNGRRCKKSADPLRGRYHGGGHCPLIT